MSIWTRPDPQSFDSSLRLAARAARDRQRAARRHGPGLTGHKHGPATEEHYHVVYHVPSENIAIPYFKETFGTAREGYLKIAELGQRAEPHVEWYEDGEVGFETYIPGRAGWFWVVVEIMGCVRRRCLQNLPRELRKRHFRFVPDDGEVVPTIINPAAVEVLGPGSVTDERDL